MLSTHSSVLPLYLPPCHASSDCGLRSLSHVSIQRPLLHSANAPVSPQASVSSLWAQE